eukprot:g10478.t1
MVKLSGKMNRGRAPGPATQVVKANAKPVRGEDRLKSLQQKKSLRGQTAPLSKQLLADKSFGQNFLKNPGILDKIMKAAEIGSHELVYEVGPGTGNLTSRLLKEAKNVIAQEIDPRMVCASQKRAQAQGDGHKILVKQGDCLKADWPPFHVLVANLPYQISSPFTFKLCAHATKWRCAVVMFQKEFAERLCARVGDKHYGRLALNTRLFAKVERVCKVDRNSFTPPPKVDSMVVKFTPQEKQIPVDFREWDGLLRVCFSRKNKTLSASFKNKSIQKVLRGNWQSWCGEHQHTSAGTSIFAPAAPTAAARSDFITSKKPRGRERAKPTPQRYDDSTDDDLPAWKQKVKKPKVSCNPASASASCTTSSQHQLRYFGMYPSIDALRAESCPERLFAAWCNFLLEKEGVAGKRAVTMEANEFLSVLLAFNRAGVHFSNVTEGQGAAGEEGGGEVLSEMSEDDEEEDGDAVMRGGGGKAAGRSGGNTLTKKAGGKKKKKASRKAGPAGKKMKTTTAPEDDMEI